MNSRHFTLIGPMSPSMAIVITLVLWPGAASAQHRGAPAIGGHTINNMNASTLPPGGMHHGMTSERAPDHGQTSSHHHPHDGYPGWFDLGWGIGGVYIGADAFGSMGMSLEDQAALKEARVMEIMNRSGLEYMQAVQAYEMAKLAWRRSQGLDQRQPTVVAGLGNLVALDRVRWPKAVKSNSGATLDIQEAAERAVIAVHQQAIIKGHAEQELVSAAKEKLYMFRDSAVRSTRITKAGRRNIALFINQLDVALDRTLRRPEAEPSKSSTPSRETSP